MKRFISSSSINLHRRSWKYLQNKSKEFVPLKEGFGNLELNSLSGSLRDDGMNRFELDFMETAEWTTELLLKMENDKFTTKNEFNDNIVCIETLVAHEYDFTSPESQQTNVKIHFSVADLGLSPSQQHSLKLLVGDKYDPYNNSVTLSETIPESQSGGSKYNHYALITKLQEQLNALLLESKNDFKDIPLSLAHVKKQRKYEFPKEWQ